MNYKKIQQYEPNFGEEEQIAMNEYMKSESWLTEHTKTKKFEQLLQQALGVKHAIVVNNGTISLSLALLAHGIKPGDKIIVPALTMIATANAVKLIGAEPVFVDIDEDNLCLDLTKTLRKIISELKEEEYIKGIIYVSLNGRRCKNPDIDTFIIFCKTLGITFIEDAAQAFGSKKNINTMIGNSDHITSFSFSPAKILSTGQGGCLTTNNDDLANKIRRLKDFGREDSGNDIHDHFGINCKFTDMQAVIGIQQLLKVPVNMYMKKLLYTRYYDELSTIKEIDMFPINIELITPWFMDIYTNDSYELNEYLKKYNIGSRQIYKPIPYQNCYGLTEKFPVASKYSYKGLWLPSSTNLTIEDIMYITEKIKDFYNGK